MRDKKNNVNKGREDKRNGTRLILTGVGASWENNGEKKRLRRDRERARLW